MNVIISAYCICSWLKEHSKPLLIRTPLNLKLPLVEM